MRRINIHIAVALSTLLLVSISFAQQNSDKPQTNSGQSASPIGIQGPVIGGDGVANYIPIWASRNYLLSSVIYQTSGNIGIGTTSPTAKLDVNGGINTATTYEIAGSTVLGIGSPTDDNVFLGLGAGSSVIAGRGVHNTFLGYSAGKSNDTGPYNTFTGEYAGNSNKEGSSNTFTGGEAGYKNIEGSFNTFSGRQAGFSNSTGYDNTFTGVDAGSSNTQGSYNTFMGAGAGMYNNGGPNQGNYNTFLGAAAGYYNTTGNNNIYIGNSGPASGTESSTIRIGGDLGFGGYGPQTAAYMAGIYGVTVASTGTAVYVDIDGRLGTQTSALRFKEQVLDMGDSTSGLMKLRPVTFLYKPEYSNGERTLQYGLIAEEVVKVYPELVAYDKDGRPYSVRYQNLTTMLLNEVQKQYRRDQEQTKVIETQRDKIDSLQQQTKMQQQEIEGLKQQLQMQNAAVQQRLSRLEKAAGTQVQTVAQN